MTLPPTRLALTAQASTKAGSRVTAPGRLPMTFIENRGQAAEPVMFSLRSGSQTLWLTREGITFDFLRAKGRTAQGERDPTHEPRAPQHPPWAPAGKYERLVFTQAFLGANTAVKIEAGSRRPGLYHYLLGNDPTKWHTGVQGYAEVIYRVWEGIDLKIAGNGHALEQEFIIKAGADPGQIRVGYHGIEGLAIDADGTLRIKTPFGELRESPPRIYQEIDGQQVGVAGRFRLVNPTTYTFEVGPYAPQYALVIDPTLAYSLVIGASTEGHAIAVDAAGNSYVTGIIASTHNELATPGAFQTALAGDFGSDAYVMKLDPLGDLVYFTFLGSPVRDESGNGIAVDTNGNTYVTGWTSGPNFPTTAGAFQPLFPTAQGGQKAAFVTKLNATGSALVYSSFLGGSELASYTGGYHTQFGADTFAWGIAVDALGNAYVAGTTNAVNFPTTSGALQTSAPGDTLLSFVTKVSPTGATLAYSTYLSSTIPGQDVQIGGIAVDAAGSAYVTGSTSGNGFPTTTGAFQPMFPCCRQAFVTKLDPTGTALVYSTFLGGSGSPDESPYAVGRGIAVDAAGHAYVSGITSFGDFPTTPGAFQPAYRGHLDGFVSKLNPMGTAPVYSTYLGGSGVDSSTGGVAVDTAGHAYVTGFTDSDDFPTTPDAFQGTATPSHCLGGFFVNHCAVFVAKLNLTGSDVSYGTYLFGPNTNAFGQGIAVDATSNIYVTGIAHGILHTDDFPATLALLLGSSALVVTKFAVGPTITKILPNAGGDSGPVTVVLVGANFQSGATVRFRREGQPDIVADAIAISDDGQTLTATFNLAGLAQGIWDVVVTNPDETSATLSAGFTIEPSTGAKVWVDIVGRTIIRTDTPETFTVLVGNSGNVDAHDLWLWLRVPKDLGVRLNVTPPSVPGVDWDQAPWGWVDGTSIVVPIWLYTVTPASPLSFTFLLQAPAGDFSVDVELWQSSPNQFTRTGDFQFVGESVFFSMLVDAYGMIFQLAPGTATLSSADFAAQLSSWLAAHITGFQLLPECYLAVAATASVLGTPIPDVAMPVLCHPNAPGASPATYLVQPTLVRGFQWAFFSGVLAPLGTPRSGVTTHGYWCGPGDTARNIVTDVTDCTDAACRVHDFRYFQIQQRHPRIFHKWRDACSRQNPLKFQQRLAINPKDELAQMCVEILAADRELCDNMPQPHLENIGTSPPFCEVTGFPAASQWGPNLVRSAIAGFFACQGATQNAADASTLLGRVPHRFLSAASRDPNDKSGPQGVGELRYVSGVQPLRYSIAFENVATATLPARQVTVTEALDTSKLDLSTVSLGPIGLGIGQLLPPAGVSEFSAEVDLQPEVNLVVKVKAKVDIDAGLLTWTFTSIDPTTGQPPTDPTVGFLPPNVNPPQGQGSVSFTVMPKPGLATGTPIENQATIVFDTNAPIATPVWANTLDNTPPTSQVAALPSTVASSSFMVQWSGTDVGSGIQDYTVYVSQEGGPFTPFVTNTTDTSVTFTGQTGHSYAFFSVAHDQAGNEESKLSAGETTTRVVGVTDTIPPTTMATTSPEPNVHAWNNTDVTVTLTATDNPGGFGVRYISFSLSGAETGGRPTPALWLLPRSWRPLKTLIALRYRSLRRNLSW